MGKAAAAVEQAGHRVREQRPAGDRPGDDLGALDELARHHVEEILRESPDRRRMTEQLMRVQVDAAVVTVAVVEVPVHHQDPRLLQVPEGFLSKLGAFVHSNP